MVAVYLLNSLATLAFPVALGAWLVRRLGRPWGLFWAGASVFLLSQVVHLPVNLAAMTWGPPLPEASRPVLLCLLLGLSAGLHEEGARWLVLRFWSRRIRDARSALLWGAGHGGVEAMIVGAIAVVVTLNVAVLTDPAALAKLGVRDIDVAPFLAATADQAWYMPLLGLVERLFCVPCHIAWAMLVLQSILDGRPWGWLTALLWHTGVDASAVATTLAEWHPLAVEGIIGANAVAAGVVIAALMRTGDSESSAQPKVVPVRIERVPIERSAAHLEDP